MTHNNVQPFKSYFTYEETKDEEVQVASHGHIVNSTVNAPIHSILCSLQHQGVQTTL